MKLLVDSIFLIQIKYIGFAEFVNSLLPAGYAIRSDCDIRVVKVELTEYGRESPLRKLWEYVKVSFFNSRNPYGLRCHHIHHQSVLSIFFIFFNSRNPSGLRPHYFRASRLRYNFNSHSPRGLRFRQTGLVPGTPEVSIHTAHAGCDSCPCGTHQKECFNSHSPRGLRPSEELNRHIRYVNFFNSHNPCGLRPVV